MTVYTNQPVPEGMKTIISLPKEISEEEPKLRGLYVKESEDKEKK